MSTPRGPFSIDGAGIDSQDLLGPAGAGIGHLLLLGDPQKVVGTVVGEDVYVVDAAYIYNAEQNAEFLRYLIACSNHKEPFDLKGHVPRIKRLLHRSE